MNLASKKNLLFICTINKMRSLTAEKMYETDKRFHVKSAGTDNDATLVINREQIEWADYVLVMERKHRNVIRKKYPDLYKTKKIICLYIPDEYEFMDNELKYIIEDKMNNLFGTKE